MKYSLEHLCMCVCMYTKTYTSKDKTSCSHGPIAYIRTNKLYVRSYQDTYSLPLR